MNLFLLTMYPLHFPAYISLSPSGWNSLWPLPYCHLPGPALQSLGAIASDLYPSNTLRLLCLIDLHTQRPPSSHLTCCNRAPACSSCAPQPQNPFKALWCCTCSSYDHLLCKGPESDYILYCMPNAQNRPDTQWGFSEERMNGWGTYEWIPCQFAVSIQKPHLHCSDHI